MSNTTPPPTLCSQESACAKAAQAIRYLADNYPECAGLEAQDPYQKAVHEAAEREVRGAYEDALRE